MSVSHVSSSNHEGYVPFSAHGIPTRSNSIAPRDDVPFDMWFDKHRYYEPLKDAELCDARCAAIVALGEGLMNTTIEAIKYIFSAIFGYKESADHLKELSTQWRGVCLTATAVISPNSAKEKAAKEKDFFEYWINPPSLWLRE